MNTPSSHESNTPPPPNPEQSMGPEQTLQLLQTQVQTLSLNLEEVQNRIDQTRGLIQTLVVGLVIAVLTTLSVSGWFAYRLLVQDQIVQREARQANEANEAMLEQIAELEARLQRQREQIQTLRDDVPGELETLSDTVQSNRRQLGLIREQLQQLESPAADAEDEQ
ncbi:MAG: hypothetical protein AAF728_12890 [Cyanobacteria bacterium P01_D01_bin.128]